MRFLVSNYRFGMHAVIFCGIQATGKTRFYADRFLLTHVHLSLDILKTRSREEAFLQTCISTRQALVIDNTNPTKAERMAYIERLKSSGFKVTGYYFQSKIAEAIARNETREGKACVPVKGILNTYAKLEMPALEEGYDELFYVSMKDKSFEISSWENAI